MIAHGLKAEVAASSSAPIYEPTAWSSTKSVPCVPGRAREGNGVAHIGEAGDAGEGAPGESRGETEAGARHRAVAARVAVPGVVLPGGAELMRITVTIYSMPASLHALRSAEKMNCESRLFGLQVGR
jgi:hypothetical protein